MGTGGRKLKTHGPGGKTPSRKKRQSSGLVAGTAGRRAAPPSLFAFSIGHVGLITMPLRASSGGQP